MRVVADRCRMDERAAIGIVVDPATVGAGLRRAYRPRQPRTGWRTASRSCRAVHRRERRLPGDCKKLGFTLACDYPSFTTYPPYENDSDQTPEQWKAWGERYRDAPACYDGIRERCKRLAGQMREGV